MRVPDYKCSFWVVYSRGGLRVQQQIGFSIFISQDTKNYQVIRDISVPAMKTTILTGQIYWYVCGWMNPIMAVPYYNYFFLSAPTYLEAARVAAQNVNQGV